VCVTSFLAGEATMTVMNYRFARWLCESYGMDNLDGMEVSSSSYK
jgi:hypothetical protein